MMHYKKLSPIVKNRTPGGLKTTYPILFGIWYGIWCTALHLLQSIDIFMDNAPASAGAGRGGAGAGAGAGCLTPPSLSAPRSGEANMPKQRKFLNKKQGQNDL